MSAHRKPKARPTTVAAVVTAAIVAPAGTAAAATYGGINPVPSTAHGLSSAGNLMVARVASVPKATPKTTVVASVPAPPPAPKPAAAPVPVDPYKNVRLTSLEPTGLYGTQQYFIATSEQWANAKTIVAITKQRGMPLYAAVIATATAIQESSLVNLTMASNYDSLGLFQQRPSEGWGTAAQITNPAYATSAFLSALEGYAPNYMQQSLWASAQAVQRSGYPTAYAQWEDQAAKMILAIANGTV